MVQLAPCLCDTQVPYYCSTWRNVVFDAHMHVKRHQTQPRAYGCQTNEDQFDAHVRVKLVQHIAEGTYPINPL